MPLEIANLAEATRDVKKALRKGAA